MTKTETERLTRMEDNQEDFRKSIEQVFKRLDKQDTILTRLDKTLNELTGGKKALLWLTGTAIGVAGLVIAFMTRHKN